MDSRYRQSRIKAFTLIEIMMVIVLIGLMASVLQLNMGINKPDEMLKTSSGRFAGVFNIAAEYSMLNNIELGVVIDKESYQFLGFDGEKWSPIADNKILAPYTLPEGIVIDVTLEDLPIDEPQLLDASSLRPEENDLYLSKDEDEKEVIPQVYILSGGDITPFRVTFYFKHADYEEQQIHYQVTGLYSIPLLIEGPLEGVFTDG
ncbi:MAG: general secretion pathway protein H [Alteromonadaceae bacterium]|jgi:general secretion pathway protein H